MADLLFSIELDGLEKVFGATRVVGPLSLSVGQDEFLPLLGPSGCGKTTTLRMVAGYESATEGVIRIGGQPVGHLPVERRGVGMVFQSYALLPHLSVAENVGFGLRLRRRPAAERDRRVAELLDLVGLGGFGPRRPKELSGGQQQRVSLARALAIEPKVLLLDEPLSSLDLKLREQMRDEIRRLRRSLGITAVAVTHDQSEAMAMSDRIAVMSGGEIAQVGTPEAIYDTPADLFVARFIGHCTSLPGRMVAPHHFMTEGGTEFLVPDTGTGPATLVIRPEAVEIGEPGATLRATVQHIVYLGEKRSLTLRLPSGEELTATSHAARGVPAPAMGETLPIAGSRIARWSGTPAAVADPVARRRAGLRAMALAPSLLIVGPVMLVPMGFMAAFSILRYVPGRVTDYTVSMGSYTRLFGSLFYLFVLGQTLELAFVVTVVTMNGSSGRDLSQG